LEKLNKHQIQIIETPVSEIEHDNGNIKTITFDDGKKLNFDVAYASIPFAQHTDLPASLGCELTEQGYIKVDGFQKTSVAGIYACGDNSSMMRALANAIFTGNMSGAMVNRELTEERF
jgi:thioredoxin reductase